MSRGARWFQLGLLLPVLLLAGCHTASGPHAYSAEGVVQAISADRHLVTIQHKAIPGYMMAMTMQFPVRDEHLLDGVERGDQIDFTLQVAGGDAWVSSVHRFGRVAFPAVAANPPPQPLGPKPGDLLPDAAFLTENGKTIHLSDFRGKVVAFTFFFTRCPLPNYCPLMNRNFAATRKLLKADPSAPRNWELLSISFDPDFDTPQTLPGFAQLYRGQSADRWLFAAAPPDTLAHLAAPLGLMVMRQGDSITHNLRTIVVDPQGRLYRQFNDNLWTASQLAQAIKEAAQAKPGA